MVEGAEVGGLELGVGVELAGVWVDGEWPRAGGRKTSEVQKSRICGKIRIRKCDLRKRNRDNH